MLVLHGNALRYGLICRQYGKQKQVIYKTTLYLLKLSTNIRLFICLCRHPKERRNRILTTKMYGKTNRTALFCNFC